MRLIHKCDDRSLRCTVLCISRHLRVRFAYFLARPNLPKLDRRRGFSNRATAAMFAATVINFCLSSLGTASQVAGFIVFIRKALILDIDHPLSEKQELLNNALQNTTIVSVWAAGLPVSIKLSLSIPYLFMLGGGISQRSHCHVEGLGPLPRATVGNPHTVHFVDWSRG